MTRRTIWLRLDPSFYKRGANYALSASHRKLALLLSIVAREHPKFVVLDVGGNNKTNGTKRDPLRSFFRRVVHKPCRKSGCTTWILVSSVRAGGADGSPRRWGNLLLPPALVARSKGHILPASSVAPIGTYSGYQRSIATATRFNNYSGSGSHVLFNAAVVAAAVMNRDTNTLTRIRKEENRLRPALKTRLPPTKYPYEPLGTERVFYLWRESSMCGNGLACLDASGMLEVGDSPRVLAPLVNAGVFIGPGLDSPGAIGDIHASPLGLMSGTVLLLNAFRTLRTGGVKDFPFQYALIGLLGLVSVLSAEKKNWENMTLAASWLLSFGT
ncbi:MAG: hypothetical protein PXZ07_08985, partial [Candidatus Eremiobacteraeota bacterium]|nr:hypothetical protein [Candidatus Eremiobacteraeota bacterium]